MDTTDGSDFLCGVVEGFYGRPWMHAQRRQLFGQMRSWGLNTYTYAPKDDEKHRRHWRTPYTPAEQESLRELIAGAREQGIDFVYAISPGLDMVYSSSRDLALLKAKLDQVGALGCASFAMLFDDIEARLCEADAAAFESFAAAHVAVTNAALAHLGARCRRMLFCPTEYCGTFTHPSVADSPYLRTVGESLDARVLVLWTGPAVIPDDIPVASIVELRAVLGGRKPVIWDNFHANDYDSRCVFLGPYDQRPWQLRQHTAGILSNPNCEFSANFVPLCTLGRWLLAGPSYSPARALKEAVAQWLPAFSPDTTHLSAAELEFLVQMFYLPHHHGALASRVLDDAQWLHSHSHHERGWCERRNHVQQVCSEVERLFSKLVHVSDRHLLLDLYCYVWDLKTLISRLRATVESSASEAVQAPPGLAGKGVGRAADLDADMSSCSEDELLAADLSEVVLPSDCDGLDAVLAEAADAPAPFPTVDIQANHSATFGKGGVVGALRRFLQQPQLEVDSSQPQIRRANVDDMPDVRRVCLWTGDAGSDATALMPNIGEALGERWAAPYLRLSGTAAFVLEDDGGVCGYVLTAADSQPFYRELVHDYLPRVAKRYPDAPGKYTPSERQLLEAIAAPNVFLPDELYRDFPAHLHLDIIPRAQGRGNGRRLMHVILDELTRSGVGGVHLEMHPANYRALAFYLKLGFVEYHLQPPPAHEALILVKTLGP